MGLKLGGETEGEYTPIPEETYLGTNVAIIDLGTQYNQKYKVYRRKVLLMWEIPDVRAQFEFEGTEYDYPKVVSRQFGATMSKRGHLRPALERWEGRTFGVGEEVELKDYLGTAALIQVVHNKSGERTYSNVGSVSKLLKGMAAPKQETKSMWFSFDEHETVESVEDVLQDFPDWIEWIVKTVRLATEYENLQKREIHSEIAQDDDVPF